MNFKRIPLACLMMAVTSVAAQTQKPVSFEMMAAKNVQLPAVQIYLAEQSASKQEFDVASMKYIKAIELGVSQAVWNLMAFVDRGKLDGKELASALKKIKSMAQEDSELSLFLANYYHDRDEYENEAFHWMNNSLRLGSKGVGEFLAGYILNEIGGAESHYSDIEAATLLKVSVDEGSGSAAFKLAKMFDDGGVVQRNLGQARFYYDIAAERGVIEANYRLAYFKEHGIGGDVDIKGAERLYKQLIQTEMSGDVHYRLSRLYMNNDDVFVNSRIDGVSHLIKAAELNNSDALYKVGVATYYGSNGFKININKAIESLKKSAYRGNKLAAQRLVQIYKNGERTIRPNKELMREFQRILTEAPKVK